MLRLLVILAISSLSSSEPPKQSRKFHLFTFSDTVPHPGLCTLAESAQMGGGILRVIGMSKRPGYLIIQSHSPTLKFIMLQEVIEYEINGGRINLDDIIIFVDGHDVFLQRSLTDLAAAYDKFPGSPYLISGEKNCWPWPHTHPSHGDWDPGMQVPPNKSWNIHRWLKIGPTDFCNLVPNNGPYRFPNIGSSMGPASLFLEVLRINNRIVLDEDMNDQGAMWLVIFRHALELNIEIDQRGEVFMNMLQYEPGDFEREPCSSNWFARDNMGRPVPPRNMLTNATPFFLHFNGPSHEDDTWVNCYHVLSEEFRGQQRGHAFHDVDHNILVSTDDLCDYSSFFRIRSFHAHPVNEHIVHWLEGLYTIPVDPGLAAWRGTNSTADRAQLGREEDLQSHHEALKKALHR